MSNGETTAAGVPVQAKENTNSYDQFCRIDWKQRVGQLFHASVASIGKKHIHIMPAFPDENYYLRSRLLSRSVHHTCQPSQYLYQCFASMSAAPSVKISGTHRQDVSMTISISSGRNRGWRILTALLKRDWSMTAATMQQQNRIFPTVRPGFARSQTVCDLAKPSLAVGKMHNRWEHVELHRCQNQQAATWCWCCRRNTTSKTNSAP